jgi:hypothetical protein
VPRHSVRRLVNACLGTVLLLAAIAPSAAALDDVTPPVGTVIINGGATWSNDPNEVLLTLAATDDLAGVASVEYRSNGGSWITRPYSSAAFSMQMEDMHQGVNTIDARWTDYAGNVSGVKSASIKLDWVSPQATVELYAYAAGSITVDVTASDANGIAGVWFSCDDGATFIRKPFASRITVSTNADGMGCAAYGPTPIIVEVRDPAGNAYRRTVYADVLPAITMDAPLTPITGHAFTVAPSLPADFIVSPDGSCNYSLAWGSDRALDVDIFDDTYGSIAFQLAPTAGRCKPWTFTLPWVPYPQFRAAFSVTTNQEGQLVTPPGDASRFMAAVDSTDRLIRESNLPFVQVLPSTYTPTVGQPVTYTRYTIGGAVPCCGDRWVAYLGEGENPTMWHQWGGSTFTITPNKTGNVLVVWDQAYSKRLVQALYDPPVRAAHDTTAPNTSAPTHRFVSGTADTGVPTKIVWTGSDTGWGIKWYRLERSVNGGAWTKVTLPTGATTSITQGLVPGTKVRYRVRATDAGNVGSWDYGRTFSVARLADQDPVIRYSTNWARVSDRTAYGGTLHETWHAGAASQYTFTGSDIGWIAEKGPGHGQAKVYIDGVYQATVDLAASQPLAKRVVYVKHFASVGQHTFRIVVVGTTSRLIVSHDGVATLR